MGLLSLMKKKQKRTRFQSSLEMQFYLANHDILGTVPQFTRFNKVSEPFDVIRANVLIKSLKNKNLIEDSFHEFIRNEKRSLAEMEDLGSFMDERRKTLPYLNYNKLKIYVPIFNSSINKYYATEVEKLAVPPFSALNVNFEVLISDPFDYYGPAIYDSPFSRLIKIKEKAGLFAFFCYDSLSIYIVNDNGRLEAEICLFDKYIKHPTTTHMALRIAEVVDAYLDGDKEEFVKLLVKNKLISSNLINKYYYDKHNRKQ